MVYDSESIPIHAIFMKVVKNDAILKFMIISTIPFIVWQRLLVCTLYALPDVHFIDVLSDISCHMHLYWTMTNLGRSTILKGHRENRLLLFWKNDQNLVLSSPFLALVTI